MEKFMGEIVIEKNIKKINKIITWEISFVGAMLACSSILVMIILANLNDTEISSYHIILLAAVCIFGILAIIASGFVNKCKKEITNFCKQINLKNRFQLLAEKGEFYYTKNSSGTVTIVTFRGESVSSMNLSFDEMEEMFEV